MVVNVTEAASGHTQGPGRCRLREDRSVVTDLVLLDDALARPPDIEPARSLLDAEELVEVPVRLLRVPSSGSSSRSRRVL
jgi:hypothetical protein